MGGGNFQSPSKKWRRTLLPEKLVLETEDDYSCRSKSENREGIDGTIHVYSGMTRFSTEGLEDAGAVVGEAIDQDVVASLPEGSLGLLRMNYHLGNQSFVPKAIGSENNNKEFFSPGKLGLDYEVTG